MLMFVVTKNSFKLYFDDDLVSESGFSIESPDEFFDQFYATLYDLKTVEKFQRNGYAKYLLDEIFEYMKVEFNLNIITLIVYKNNESALKLYNGFEIFREYDDSYSVVKHL